MSDSIIDALLFGQKRAVAKAAGSVSSERLYGEATGINWCEKDYQVTPYICEFWNTCTNIVYVYFGLYCLRETWRLKLPRRFAWFSVFSGVLFVSICLVVFFSCIRFLSVISFLFLCFLSFLRL